LTRIKIPIKFGRRISAFMFWKKWPRRSSGEARRGEIWSALCALLILVGARAEGADQLKQLQDRFDSETHATSKVKVLDKLAAAQFDAATKAGDSGDYVTVGLTLEKYRDNVRSVLQLLKKQEPDADRHPNGYRQLELQVRRGMREVAETIVIAPGEMRPPLELVHKDLLDMDDELIRLLFPRHTKDPQKVPMAPEEKQ
jgi:hypothetical protein